MYGFGRVVSANQVVWVSKARTFDLRVKDVPLEVFLGMVKAETGWEVKVELGLQQIVSGTPKQASPRMRFD